jgi:hypothetical protein
MPEMPFPITGQTIGEVRLQTTELLRILFEDRIGGYARGDLTENKYLSLNSTKDVVSTEESGYAQGILGTTNITVTDNGDGTVTLTFVPTMATWVAGTTNQIDVADDGDGTITLSLPQDVDMTGLEALIYYSGGQ